MAHSKLHAGETESRVDAGFATKVLTLAEQAAAIQVHSAADLQQATAFLQDIQAFLDEVEVESRPRGGHPRLVPLHQGAVINHHTPVLNHLHPGPRQPLGHGLVPDAGLQPHRLGPLRQDVLYMTRYIC
jgi:hypothetical protein